MKHFVPSSCTGRLLALVVALVGFCGGSSVWAFNPGVTKLHGRSPETKIDFRFGQSVALSDLWLVVGEPQNDEIGDFAGAVQVFDARTGRFLRKITATDLPSFSFFGTSVSVCGNLALIGAPGANGGIGAAFIYDLKTGKRLAQFDPAFGVSGDDFGTAVSLGGDWALCGAPGFNGDKGAAYLFDVKTATQLARYQNPTPVVERFGSAVSLCGNLAAVGVPEHDTPVANAGAVFLFDASDRASQAPASLRKLSAADPVLNGAFGQSVSLYGHLLLTGAKGATGAAIGSGAAYLHDVRTGGELGKLFTVDGLFGQDFGSGVSLSGNLALIGAQSGNGNSTGTGAAYLFDVSRRVELAKWIAPDGQGGDRYGVSVALCGGSALVGAHLDDDQANNSGAAYYYRNISGPLQLTSKAKSGDFAPGIIGADFVSFANVYLNDQDELAFAGALTNKMKGVWGTYAGTLAPIGKPGEDVSTLNPGYGTGTTIGSAFAPIPEHGENAIFRIIAKGPNQKGTNSGAILQNGDAGFVPMLKMNDVAPIGDGAFQSFPEMVQNASNGNVVASYTLRKGAFGVTSSNDTGVAALDKTGNLLVNGIIPVGRRYREGENASSLTSGGGDKLGQLFGRVATGDGAYFYFPSYVIPGGGGTAFQGLFFSSATGSSNNAAIQGDPGVAVPNTLFRSFLGETVKGSYAVYRATLVGDVGQAAVPSSRDEGLFSERGFLVFREGYLPGNINAIPQASDVVVNRILGYWGLDGGDTVVALLQLRGPGVTSANDGALYLAKHDGFRQQLLREGDVVGDCDCPRIGIIQRVDVDTVAGNYIVLASLTGSKARNQAILTGKLSLGDDTTFKIYRQPSMRLRKGAFYQATLGQATTVRSLVLSPTTDRTGAGAKGLGQVINSGGKVALTVEFNNNAKEIMLSQP